ncbi:MAG TPA: Gfo/Idh/MocA family oxidoreductase [Patescibacteria group bacterium]|nr:Gfo/Idh/MocA family oxidoreductase [Patescibacteria group bacterium]
MKTKPNNNQSKINRRQFLQATTIASTGFMVLPAGVLGLRAGTSPNEKLNVAGIGIGGQGASDLGNMESENIVALCDVDQNHAAHVFKKYPNAKQFTDYRKMLDEMKEIDGVVVATPDHLHAFASMEAIKRGKHVYCEKPLTHSVWEARQLAKAAREAKVVTQMGNQGQASRETRHLCELVWSGVIGKVHEAHIWTDRPSNGLFNEYWPQGVSRPKDTPPVPSTLNWDLWLGPAPERPYNPAYLPFKWRGWWDFGTGALGDIGCHSMDPVFRALKLGAPTTVQGSSTRVNDETFPLGSMVTYQFPARTATIQANNVHVAGMSGTQAGGLEMPACKLVWYDGGLRPPRPDLLPEGQKMGDNGKMLVGEKGFILSNVNNQVFPESCAKEAAALQYKIPPSPGHYKEWIAACKGGKKPGSNFDWAGPLAESVLLGNVALRVQLREDLTLARLMWDSEQLKFTNLEDANKFVRREYRAGWSL